MQTVDALELVFASILGVATLFIIAQCLFTHKTIYDVFKSETYRLVSNGLQFKIQQKYFLLFWVDYYGFAVKREDGCLDITIMSEEQGKEILAALKQQALENRAKRNWRTIAQ
jgi:hypothetical protein